MEDLKDRTRNYAISVRRFVKTLKTDSISRIDHVQLIRASGSVGANFIEAVESLSKKDFIYRMRVCLKEAKESRYWLIIIEETNSLDNDEDIIYLKQESLELIRIFSTIIQKHKP